MILQLQRASNFACGGFSAPRVVWRRLFGRLTRQGGAMAGFTLSEMKIRGKILENSWPLGGQDGGERS